MHKCTESVTGQTQGLRYYIATIQCQQSGTKLGDLNTKTLHKPKRPSGLSKL